MKTKEILVAVGGIALILVIICLGFIVASFGFLAVSKFLVMAIELGKEFLPFLFLSFTITFGFTILVIAPLAVFTATRGLAGKLLFVVSFIFGFISWMYCLIYTYSVWGLGAVIFGVAFMGIGVIAVAAFASIYTSSWWMFSAICVAVLLILICRKGSLALLNASKK